MNLADLSDADVRALALRIRRLWRDEPPPHTWRDELAVTLTGTVVRKGSRGNGWSHIPVLSDWRDGVFVDVVVPSNLVRLLPLKGVRIRATGRAFSDGPASRQLIADRFTVLPADEDS